MRIKKKYVLKESLLNEASVLDTLSHIPDNVKKVLKLINKKFVPKNDPNFRFWQLSEHEIRSFLKDEMGIPPLDAIKISRFFINYGEKLFKDGEEYIYDLGTKETFYHIFSDYKKQFIKNKHEWPDINFKLNIDGKEHVWDDYEVWDGYNSFNIYLGFDFSAGTSGLFYVYFSFDEERNMYIEECTFKYDNDVNERIVVELLPQKTKIEHPENDSYESFVKWMNDLILKVKNIVESKKLIYKTDSISD